MLRNTLLFSVSIVLVLAISMPAAGQFTELLRTNPLDPVKDARYGNVTAVSGNIAIVGSHAADGGSGAAYLIDVTTGAQLAKLTDPAPGGNDFFGYSVAIEGNTAVIGAARKGNWSQGGAYLYDISNPMAPTLIATITAAPGNAYGHNVGISGNTVIVGSRNHAAYLFNATTGAHTGTLTAPGDADFGIFVSISGNTVAVSDVDGNKVHLFDVSNPAAPTVGAVLTQSGQFGFGNNMSGNMAVFSSIADNSNRGAAYLYNVSDINNPVQVGSKLTAADGQTGNFGFSVGIDGSFAVVGRRSNNSDNGRAFVYDLAGNFVQELIPSDLSLEFGAQGVSIDGNILVGAMAADGIEPGGGSVRESGAVYVFGNPIPEPTSLVLAALGMLALLGFGRRRRRRHAG